LKKTKPFSITKRQVWEAYKLVHNRGKSAGCDGQDWAMFDTGMSKHLYKIWNRMASGSYMPPAVKCVEIDKAGGGKRYLGVPAVSDRVAQMVVKRAFEAVVEPI